MDECELVNPSDVTVWEFEFGSGSVFFGPKYRGSGSVFTERQKKIITNFFFFLGLCLPKLNITSSGVQCPI